MLYFSIDSNETMGCVLTQNWDDYHSLGEIRFFISVLTGEQDALVLADMTAEYIRMVVEKKFVTIGSLTDQVFVPSRKNLDEDIALIRMKKAEQKSGIWDWLYVLRITDAGRNYVDWYVENYDIDNIFDKRKIEWDKLGGIQW